MLAENDKPVLPKSCGKSFLESGHSIANTSMQNEFLLLREYGTYSNHLHLAGPGFDPDPPKVARKRVPLGVCSAVEMLTYAGERGRCVR